MTVRPTARIGVQVIPGDPFWVQVRELMLQRAAALSIKLIEIEDRFGPDDQDELLELLLVQGIDVLVCNIFPEQILEQLLSHGLQLIYLLESTFRHPRFTARVGLDEAAHTLGVFLTEQLNGSATVLVVGGLQADAPIHDTGRSRLAGFDTALPADGRFATHHLKCLWEYEAAYTTIAAFLRTNPALQIDAVFGLSDPLALAARDAWQALRNPTALPLIVGINGDPLALAAVAEGTLTATVETDVEDIAVQAVDLAHQAALGTPLPRYLRHRQRLVTSANVVEVAMQKLISLADLPTKLVGVNRHHEQQRLRQLETSLVIDRQVGQILDEAELARVITALIRDTYGFDQAQFLRWDATAALLVPFGQPLAVAVTPEPDGPLAHALQLSRVVFIPDTSASHRFTPEPLWSTLRARAVVPVHHSGAVIGVLDLHGRHAMHLTREELNGLQSLADQLGISLRNAELYGQALAAQTVAERADRLKTGLLANVSHELRNPLNIILGYSQTALDTLRSLAATPPDPLEPAVTSLTDDVNQIRRSGKHLQRLIADLLDLSRAEIGELNLVLERIEPRALLKEVYHSSQTGLAAHPAVSWRLELPTTLPAIDADPVRLRQVLLNLLHNAQKFTEQGTITLGATADAAAMTFWVQDTGSGIAPEHQEEIFAPFVSGTADNRRRDGVGLGLSIARQLVLLHQGQLSVESVVGQGSTFRVTLPLPVATVPTLLFITLDQQLPETVERIALRRGLGVQLRAAEQLAAQRAALIVVNTTTLGSQTTAVLEEIQLHPQFSQIPLLFYQESDEPPATAKLTTGLLPKPLAADTLPAALADLCTLPEGSILVVDDEPQTRALYRRIIAEQLPGYQVLEAEDGQTALAVVAQHIPALIILDLAMPELDGFAVLAALRAAPETSVVPVLVLSGRALTAEDIRQLSAGRAVYQSKDILSEAELVTALRRTLDRSAALPPHTSALVKGAVAYIQQHFAEPLSRQQIAESLGVSKDYLGRLFHQELGLSPWDYLIRYRVLRAKLLLTTTDTSITEIAAQVGFESSAYFSAIFNREVGSSPRAFRAQNQG